MALGMSLGIPAYCPGAVRRRGGASPVRALARNVGTCAPLPTLVILCRGEREILERLNP
jgi:hypothetical protein